MQDLRAYRQATKHYPCDCLDEPDCLFGSALGAAYRGADPIVCYYWAIYRASVFARSMTKSHVHATIRFVACAVWISRDLEGWGLPTFSRFITKESQTTLEGGFVVPVTFIRHLHAERPLFSANILKVVQGFIDQEHVKRGPLAIFADPYGVQVVGLQSIASHGDAAVKRLARSITTSDVFSRVFRTLDGVAYPELIQLLLDTWDAPAALVLAASEYFPSHFVDQLPVRCEKNECIVRKMQFCIRGKVLCEIRSSNRKALDIGRGPN